jgi:hypothetical protein
MKALFSVFSFVALLLLGISSQAEDAYNCDDPKCQQEKSRMANQATMNAQFLSRGIPCETGACFKDADSALGFDTTPLINVDGAADKPRVSPADIVQ